MALVSHRWPFITPWTLEEGLPMTWWAYYVRAAKAELDAAEKARNKTARGGRRG